MLQHTTSRELSSRPEAYIREETHPRVALIAAGKEITGGHEVQARALVEELSHSGFKVRFIPINPPFPRCLRWLRGVRYLRTAMNQSLYLFSLKSLRQVEVVHVFSASYWSFLLAPVPAMAVGRILGKRVVLHYHSGEAEDHLKNWAVLVHPWLRLAHEIVVPSEFLLDVFSRFGHRTRMIRNIVDTSKFSFRERELLRPRLLSVRNFEQHYRVDMTLRAFAHIKECYPEATLTVAGTGSEEESLRLLAEKISIDDVHFSGCVGPDHIARLYDDCDIFLNSSVVDNQPVSILEAFAAGLPVVTTATGDIAAMVCDGETGCIVPPMDPVAMADAVIWLLDNPNLAAQIARRARAGVKWYTWPQVEREWMSVYGDGSARELGS